jgi:hypothetical protein
MPEYVQEENTVFDPIIWGPHYWFVLMTLALSYPDNITAVTKRKYYDFITNLPVFIPNPKIANQFSHLLDKYPVSPYLDRKESFIKWVHFIHNKINGLLGKDEISYSEAINRYFAQYQPQPIILSDRFRWKKYLLVSSIILACFFFIYLYWE